MAKFYGDEYGALTALALGLIFNVLSWYMFFALGMLWTTHFSSTLIAYVDLLFFKLNIVNCHPTHVQLIKKLSYFMKINEKNKIKLNYEISNINFI